MNWVLEIFSSQSDKWLSVVASKTVTPLFSSLWTGFRMIPKERREPACFEFYKSDLWYKRLLLLVPNFNTTSDENGVIYPSYLLLLK